MAQGGVPPAAGRDGATRVRPGLCAQAMASWGYAGTHAQRCGFALWRIVRGVQRGVVRFVMRRIVRISLAAGRVRQAGRKNVRPGSPWARVAQQRRRRVRREQGTARSAHPRAAVQRTESGNAERSVSGGAPRAHATTPSVACCARVWPCKSLACPNICPRPAAVSVRLPCPSSRPTLAARTGQALAANWARARAMQECEAIYNTLFNYMLDLDEDNFKVHGCHC